MTNEMILTKAGFEDVGGGRWLRPVDERESDPRAVALFGDRAELYARDELAATATTPDELVTMLSGRYGLSGDWFEDEEEG